MRYAAGCFFVALPFVMLFAGSVIKHGFGPVLLAFGLVAAIAGSIALGVWLVHGS